jgi:hypothetical protein
LIPFAEISSLGAGEKATGQVSIKFVSASQAVKFEVVTDQATSNVSIVPFVGELVRAASISQDEFADQESMFCSVLCLSCRK